MKRLPQLLPERGGPGRFGGAHQIRPEMHHHSRLHRPGVNAVTPLSLREIHVCRPGKTEPARVYDQHSQLVTKPETGSLQRVPVSAVTVAQYEPPHPDQCEGLARPLDQSGQLLGLEGERSRKTHMLPATADRLRRQSPGRKVVRQPPERCREQAEPDLEVGRKR